MEQRDADWHEARRTTINASEAGALLGLSPYTSAKQARKEWIKKYHGERRDFDNADMARGRQLEPAILEALEVEYDEVILQDAGRIFEGWLRASSDGFCPELDGGHVFEVKAPRKFFEWGDRLDYVCQLYLQMVCYGMDFGVLAQGVEHPISGDLARDLNTTLRAFSLDEAETLLSGALGHHVIPALKLLHEEMIAAPVEEEVFTNTAWEAAQEAYAIAKLAESNAKALMAEARERLLIACDDKPVRGTRWQVIESTRKGNVDWKRLQTDTGVDLDKYRGQPTTSMTVRGVK